jgi:hypothetical protein
MKNGWTHPRARAWRYRLGRLGWPLWAGLAATLAAVALGPLLTDPLREQAAEWDAQARARGWVHPFFMAWPLPTRSRR